MKTPNRDGLVPLFSDAHVVDVDFSTWDDWIGLLIIPDHLEPPGANLRLPVVLVKFHRVSNLAFEFSHYSAMARVRKTEPNVHFQWHIDDFRVTELENQRAEYRFWAGDADPRLTIVCEWVSDEQLEIGALDAAFPRWSAPGAGFVRPSTEAVAGRPR